MYSRFQGKNRDGRDVIHISAQFKSLRVVTMPFFAVSLPTAMGRNAAKDDLGPIVTSPLSDVHP